MRVIEMRAPYGIIPTLALGALLLVIVWWLLRLLSGVLLLFVLAAILAFILAPVVDMIERRLGGHRAVAILLAYLFAFLVVTGVGFLVVPPLVGQARQAAAFVPAFLQELRDPEAPWARAGQSVGIGTDLASALSSLSVQLQSFWDDIARGTFALARGIGTSLVDALLVSVITFYMLAGRHSLQAVITPFVSAQHHVVVARVESRMADVLGRYLRARLVLSLLVGILTGGAAALMGLPFPIVLGTVAAVFDLIPFLGPILGIIPALIVALIMGPPVRALAILGAFVIIQQIEGNLLAPKLVADAVRLPPLLVIFTVLAGAELAGAWGALLAAPLAGCAVVAAQELAAARRTKGGEDVPAPSPQESNSTHDDEGEATEGPRPRGQTEGTPWR